MRMKVLISNAGSTSLKFKLFNMADETALCDARVERVGSLDSAIFTYINLQTGAKKRLEGLSVPEYTDGINLFLRELTGENGVLEDIDEIEAVGFKTVIAQKFLGDHELTDEVMADLARGARIAPAHNLPYIEAINVFKRLLPSARMVGAFETDFHKTVPFERQVYSVPYAWYEKYGIRRYGYHGASHGYVAERIASLTGGRARRVISCHLGGSGSLCAILDGKSVDSTCGFSLQRGLPHSSRAGDIDPYIFPFLLGEGLSAEEITRGITKNGGLLGVSGVSGDMRDLETAIAQGNERARLAVEMYLHAIIAGAGALYAVLGGLDALVFTGGIGENSAMVRARVCHALAHLGIELDEAKNEGAHERRISRDGSPAEAWVVPANEEINVARRVAALLRRG